MQVGKLGKTQKKKKTQNKSQKKDKEKGRRSEAKMSSVMWRALTSCSP